jgi:hypothetical protein
MAGMATAINKPAVTASQRTVTDSDVCSHIRAVAALPAVALLALVHRTILAGLVTARLIGGKRDGAHCREQNGTKDLSVSFHTLFSARKADQTSNNMRLIAGVFRPSRRIKRRMEWRLTAVEYCSGIDD